MDSVPADLIYATGSGGRHARHGCQRDKAHPSTSRRARRSIVPATSSPATSQQLQRRDGRAYGGNVSFGRVLGASQRWGIVGGASYSYRRYDTQLLNGSSDTWTSFSDATGAARSDEVFLRRGAAAAGRQRVARNSGRRAVTRWRSASITTCFRTPKAASSRRSTSRAAR